MEDEGKGDGHQYRRKPRTPEPIPIAGNSPSEEEMGHWTPTGVEPKNYDDDDDDERPKVPTRPSWLAARRGNGPGINEFLALTKF